MQIPPIEIIDSKDRINTDNRLTLTTHTSSQCYNQKYIFLFFENNTNILPPNIVEAIYNLFK